MQPPVLVDFSQLDTTKVTSLKVSLEKLKKSGKMKGDPKVGASLHRLREAHRLEGLLGAKAFAKSQNMVLQDDRVQVTIVTSEDSMAPVREAVKDMGGKNQLHYRNLLQAFVPISALKALAGRPDIQLIREPQRVILLEQDLAAIPMTGTVTTEGVTASSAASWQGNNMPCTGRGVRVAVIDGGFADYTTLLGTDLPSSVNFHDWTSSGPGTSPHGTACAEIIYDMAPGITLDLHRISTGVEFGNAVDQAIADGADIISASIGWTIDGPGDGTGFLADIVKNARQNGILYAAAAGNNAEYSWSGTFSPQSSDMETFHLWAPGQNINGFGSAPGSYYVLPAGYQLSVALYWDDWTVVDQDYDLLLVGNTGVEWVLVDASTYYQDGSPGQTPIEYIGTTTPFEGPYGLVVARYSSTRNVCFRLLATHTGPPINTRVAQRSLVFPADSPDAITVGAVDVSSFLLEDYSSQGPTFGPGGACTGGAIKPDIASYANVSTVSYGAGIFNGTSAATPHVAGAAALVRQAYPSYTVAQVQQFLETNAMDLGTAGKDNLFGAGRLYLGPPASCVATFSPGIPILLLDEQ
jgi:subtilisin family serine protease